MMKIKGKYNTAIIYAETVEHNALEQIKEICDLSIFADSKIRIMPDIHAGEGSTIGTTMTIADKVAPNLIGADIGCGMHVCKLTNTIKDFPEFDKIVKASTSGKEKQGGQSLLSEAKSLINKLKCKNKIDTSDSLSTLGTLGGGNHFVEIDRSNNNDLYLIIHSGSRNLGTQVAGYYQKKANTSAIEWILTELNNSGREKEIPFEQKRLSKGLDSKTKRYAFLSDTMLEDYLFDISLVQSFASVNRTMIADSILRISGNNYDEAFETVHNYIDMQRLTLRKGAVSAEKGEKLIIPINMRDGCLMCIGKGNPGWNYSAPHGAGRILKRGDAKEILMLEEYEQQMQGIYSSCINMATIDESPMAYKPLKEILSTIEPTVDIIEALKPIYNYKSSTK